MSKRSRRIAQNKHGLLAGMRAMTALNSKLTPGDPDAHHRVPMWKSPDFIDGVSQKLFPVAFTVFNLIYWFYYAGQHVAVAKANNVKSH